MALVKTSRIVGSSKAAPSPETPPRQTEKAPPPARKRSAGPHRDKIAERVAAATEQLASGMAEAAAAAEELRRSMEQIASGAEQAAAGSQEQLTSIKSVVGNLGVARTQAETSRRRTEAVQLVLTETAVQITTSVRSIERNAARQTASIEIVAELERRARDIGEITQTVSRISDQTNLLALNAAIEAARAGDLGLGFAVVADEVRALAETSDRSAQDVQGVADVIQREMRGVVEELRAAAELAVAEAEAGTATVAALDAVRQDMARLTEGSDATLTASLEAERAASEAQRGAEQVAAAAEEQAAAAVEAQRAIQQQVASLEQGQAAAHGLAALTGKLAGEAAGDATAEASAAEQLAASSEQLSATIQELSSAATEILAAVDQINRGSQMQAAATQQTSAALGQIEAGARVAQTNAVTADQRVAALEAAIESGRHSVQRLMNGVTSTADRTRASLATILRLEDMSRRIEKIVDGIGLLAVQTTMLAVSGSIEGARAGSAGRGFALVSGDIRNLAREASESVERAKDTVRAILDQIAILRRDCEQVIATAESEAQNNLAITEALEKLDADIVALRNANKAILDGAASIMTGAVEAAAGARQIAAAAEEASSAARQAAAAASQQARGAEDLAAAIEEIASLADELRRQRNG